ncbi:AMP-binding protein [Actinoplanes sp. TBRC 11911]|uniref:AMP-binding protein n=1 Tax=Actinoplanes sp. TBRC 11911 TaxID=2729386 RepID=UPI00145ED607|nr:AMP-binding protein [Actinoplanes sp. TBRC 11911]NMO55422.1 AMP-binding protein [Actinoplanes sp. TBRC 11911]
MQIDDGLWPPAMFEPQREIATHYHEQGWWRPTTLLDDLVVRRRETPNAVAVRSYHAEGGSESLSWSQYADRVERYAAALRSLGAGPGRVVAVQMPNLWQTSALILAVLRTGAVVAPITTTFRARELERMLDCLKPVVVITVAEFDMYNHATALAEMRTRLPFLRTTVVFGDGPADINFHKYFEQRQWEPLALADARDNPDRVAAVMFTSGTTGEPKAVLHTYNTMYAGGQDYAVQEEVGPADVMFNPHALTHMFGLLYSLMMPATTGATAVLLDEWSPAAARTVIDDAHATLVSGSPQYLIGLWEQYPELTTASISRVITGATTVPPNLVSKTRAVTGVALQSFWAMTEVMLGTWTRRTDPPDWSAHSDGRPGAGTELDLRGNDPIDRNNPAALFMRGPSVCIATVGRDSGKVTMIADHDEGWYETGDLAIPDGRNGIRLMGRTADRINRGFVVPAADVEAELLNHPGIRDVALVGVSIEGEILDEAVAVIVPSGPPPSLNELNSFLTARGMTDWCLPTQLKVVDTLPRNTTGKILKNELRRELRVTATGGAVFR